MSIKKLTYYLEDAEITLRSDHLPLKRFLQRNTLNTKVNNWAVEISPFKITFEYIKGIKNTLADTMSRLIALDPDNQLVDEPEGFEYGYYAFNNIDLIETQIEINEMTNRKGGEAPVNLPDEEVTFSCYRRNIKGFFLNECSSPGYDANVTMHIKYIT